MADRKRRRKRSSAVVLLNGLLSLLVLAMVAVGGVFVYGVHIFYEPGPKDADAPFLVERGSNLSTTQTRLAEQGFVADGAIEPLVFNLATRILGSRAAKLLPGQYMIPAHASMASILEIITETKPQEFFVNVVPGETSWEVAEMLNNAGQNLSGDPVTPPREGTLLAARHDFFPGDTRQSVLDAMSKAQADKLAEIWAAHDPAIEDVIKTPEQLVVMASLVEKETGVETERAQVASVFINRLRKKMRLQTDPSVIYGITLGKGKLERGLTTADLKAKTPYNTYQIDGLPPGPIANPGEAAMLAVAHPAATNYLYFVAKTADPADGHLFAATYAEHRKNVALYRQAVKQSEADAEKDTLEQQQASEAGDATQ